MKKENKIESIVNDLDNSCLQGIKIILLSSCSGLDTVVVSDIKKKANYV